ncbi:hypothetical protein JW916_13055 [Candidatus Sumerlaeota bacterium]|nr:hypothetical protein [Candidatus Sumerlaeota bacterium]
MDPGASARVEYAFERLATTLASVGIAAERLVASDAPQERPLIVLGRDREGSLARRLGSPFVSQSSIDGRGCGAVEGFSIRDRGDGAIVVAGRDDNGVLYGAMDLADRIIQAGGIPESLNLDDAPAFVLRGPCVAMQKTQYLPGRKVYEYPYTPESFPFFYDKGYWKEYLDFLVAHRMNSLYLWNGHPFASLVRLPDYPYALEVPEDVFKRNVEMFRYLTEEADRRGLWVIQKFYNVFVSKPFAEHHGIETQQSRSTPLLADYTRKSISEFVYRYPSVGLLVCLGEALNQAKECAVDWFCNVVVPGVRDGMERLGLTGEPPIVLRAHATADPVAVVEAALPLYKNLYTMAKYNGESLTTWEPRGRSRDIHLGLSHLGSVHIANVHILANLEPFRYGAQRFIRKCMVASRDCFGARGLHLYPLAYWDWPNAPDKTEPLLKQYERDRIWFEAWARYAWNPDRDETEDRAYWVERLEAMYGSRAAAEAILDAYNDAGECAPRILRRFGITEGNRQTLSLGMTLDQLVNPKRYRPFSDLWESQAPPGERLPEYVAREWEGGPHEGETPPQIIEETLAFSRKAVEAIERAAPNVSRNREEFERLRNDIYCIRALSGFYAAKVRAATLVLRFVYSKDVTDMESAARHLEESVNQYRELVRRTENTYRYANTMQTNQRKIPVPGGFQGKPANYHWRHLVGIYEEELTHFKENVEELKERDAVNPFNMDESDIRTLPRVQFTLHSAHAEVYEICQGARVFTDRDFCILDAAPELVGLRAIRFSHEEAKKGRYVPIEFEAAEPFYLLVGYFLSEEPIFLQVPNLDTAAHADDQGGLDPVIESAMTVSGCPRVNVHAFRFEKGRRRFDPIGRGSFLILGVVSANAVFDPRDARRCSGR